MAHMLPPTPSERAASACPLGDESKRTSLPVVSKHHADATSIINTKSRTSITARIVARPDASTKGSAKAVIQSGVDSPSPGGTLTAQPSYEASLSTRQTENETVINKEQMRRLRHPPVPLTTHLCPRRLPASSVQDRPSRLPDDELRQPRIVVPKPVLSIQPAMVVAPHPAKEESAPSRRSKDKPSLERPVASRS
jgi:hypothetical protein